MIERARRHLVVVLSAASIAGALALVPACGGGASEGARAPIASTSQKPWGGFSDAAFSRYHSARLGVSFPLPERPAWSISDRDDAAGGWLVARHVASSTVLRVRRWEAGTTVTRLMCEERAREIKELPTPAEEEQRFVTLTGELVAQPKGWEGRHWVATEDAPDGRQIGHVFLISARKRTCLFVHATAELGAAGGSQIELADRLEVLSSRVVAGIGVEAAATPLSLPPPKI